MKKVVICLLLLVTAFSSTSIADAASFNNFTKQYNYIDGQFTDVSSTSWYAEYIQTAYEYGLLIGTAPTFPTTFCPNNNITIAETIVLAARLHSTYYDINILNGDYQAIESTWYDLYVQYCIKNGIIGKYEFSDYTKVITRSQFAKIMASSFPGNALTPINNVTDNSIPDVKMSDQNSDAIYKLYRAGILTGNDEHGTFAPDSNIDRSSVAAIVSRVVNPSLRKHISLNVSTPPTPNTSDYYPNTNYLTFSNVTQVALSYTYTDELLVYVYKFNNVSDLTSSVKKYQDYLLSNGFTIEVNIFNVDEGYTFIGLRKGNELFSLSGIMVSNELLVIPPQEEDGALSSQNNSYEAIFNSYSGKLKTASSRLVAEFKQEAVSYNSISLLAELCNEKVSELASICTDGMNEMASLMLKTNGSYSEYETWASRLQDVYMQEASKITDAYLDVAI